MVRLNVGDPAPEISGMSINMGEFKLSNLKGRNRALIIFSRYFGCTVCQIDFKELLEAADEIQKTGRMIYITQSGEENAREAIEGKRVSFPVMLDPMEPYPLYKAYGVEDFGPQDLPKIRERAMKGREQGFQHGAYEGNEKQSPADFIVSTDGRIDHAHYGVLDLEQVLQLWEKDSIKG